MPTIEFFERLASRIDRIDRKHLQEHVLNLIHEKKFFTYLLDQLPEGIAVIREHNKISFMNRRFKQLFNVGEDETPALEEVLQDEPLQKLILNTIDGNEELYSKETEVLLPRPMILLVTLSSHRLKTDRFRMLFIRSFTQNEWTMREKNQLQNMESLIGLATGLAHELGNPINSMSIHLQLMKQAANRLSSEERKKIEPSLEALREEMNRLDKIIRNFLTAARRKPLHFEVESIHRLLDKTLALLRPELKACKIKWIVNEDPKIPEFLMDAERIHQVFLNVIKNAVHAMPDGGTLEIKTRVKDKLCSISFQDTGVGISKEHLPKIFDAYYTTKEGGSGLGLMIVYQIIREHGGRVEVESKLEEGTKFTVILPIRKEKLGLPKPELEKKK